MTASITPQISNAFNAYIILPLIILVALGQLAAKMGQIKQDDWVGIEKLSFKIMLPETIDHTLTMISRGALAVGLLCVGAGFQLRRLLQYSSIGGFYGALA